MWKRLTTGADDCCSARSARRSIHDERRRRDRPKCSQCALAALVRGITKIRTARRGLRAMPKMRSAMTHRAQPQKSFLLRSETWREGRGSDNAKNSQKGTAADRAAKASATCYAT